MADTVDVSSLYGHYGDILQKTYDETTSDQASKHILEHNMQ